MCFRPPVVEAGVTKCPLCGAEVPEGVDTCANCGATSGNAGVGAAPPPPVPGKGIKAPGVPKAPGAPKVPGK